MAWIKFLEVYLGKNAENFLTCKQYSNLDRTVIMEQSSMQVESCIIWDYALLCQTLSSPYKQPGITLSHASLLAVLLDVSEFNILPSSVTVCCFLMSPFALCYPWSMDSQLTACCLVPWARLQILQLLSSEAVTAMALAWPAPT